MIITLFKGKIPLNEVADHNNKTSGDYICHRWKKFKELYKAL